jgi:hypothetical protein
MKMDLIIYMPRVFFSFSNLHKNHHHLVNDSNKIKQICGIETNKQNKDIVHLKFEVLSFGLKR